MLFRSGSVPLRVDLVEELGESRLLHGSLDGGLPLTLRLHHDRAFASGETIGVDIDPGRTSLFDAAGRRL